MSSNYLSKNINPLVRNESILEIYTSAKAILKGHFQLASGQHSDTYMQSAKLFMYPQKSRIICEKLKAYLNSINIDCVISPAIGGILMGYEMAFQLGVPNIFCERIEGKMLLRRGFSIEEGKKYLIVEDVVTTGGSVKEVIQMVEQLGGNIIAIASIVDRSNGTVDFGKTYISLLQTNIISWNKDQCPLCKQNIPLNKPGSKALG
ncbi:MAG: orotate phosphoribosyltransferase [Chitinophagaceae bacterium]